MLATALTPRKQFQSLTFFIPKNYMIVSLQHLHHRQSGRCHGRPCATNKKEPLRVFSVNVDRLSILLGGRGTIVVDQ